MAEDDCINCIDKNGDCFRLSSAGKNQSQALREMYDLFSPKAVTQGLPPADTGARYAWIQHLLDNGRNFVAWQGEKIIGHSSLILDPVRKDGEYLIFVNQTFRNRGLGTALTEMVLKKAQGLDVESIWLTVEALNFRAIKLYKKMGFTFCDCGERERTMILRLKEDGTEDRCCSR